jgi:hypothetical protein
MQVASILTATGLGQCADKILSKGVSGEMFAKCDEEQLERELGVTSKLHRLKLLRIIEGKAPTEWYQQVH